MKLLIQTAAVLLLTLSSAFASTESINPQNDESTVIEQQFTDGAADTMNVDDARYYGGYGRWGHGRRGGYNECYWNPTGSALCRGRNFCGISVYHPKCQNYCSVYPYYRVCY